jgi:integrase
MIELVSEELPNDGGFQLHKLLKATNERLGKLGKHGKRAKLKHSGGSISLQFNFKGQQQRGCGCSFTKDGIKEAEKIAELVTTQLSANNFTWEWFNALIGKKIESEKEQKYICKNLIEEYKGYWFKENKKLKKPDSAWYLRFRYIEIVMSQSEEILSSEIVKEIISKTENGTRARTWLLQGLTHLLHYFDLVDYDRLIESYRVRNKPILKKRNVPSDERIKIVFRDGFIPHPRVGKKIVYRYNQWQFLYGLLATYGLRIHEAWNVANWDKPAILNRGDWLAIEENLTGDEDKYKQYAGEKLLIPAILDPTNTDKILCIKHNTKTGYRMAIPISPRGENWIEEFNLIQPFNIPDLKNPLDTYGGYGAYICSARTCRWFLRHNYGFTPHDLRHAYNHRGHELGYNPTLLSKSLGHSLEMNSTTYLKTMADSRSLDMMKEAIVKEQEKQSELERLRAENEYLKQENEKLKTENQLYQSLLEQVRLK